MYLFYKREAATESHAFETDAAMRAGFAVLQEIETAGPEMAVRVAAVGRIR